MLLAYSPNLAGETRESVLRSVAFRSSPAFGQNQCVFT